MTNLRTWLLFGLTVHLLVGSANADPTPFTNFMRFRTTEGNAGFGLPIDSPPIWYEGEQHESLPGLDGNSRHDWVATYGAFVPVGEDPLVIAAPFTTVASFSDFDEEGNLIGVLSVQGNGTLETDLNFDAAIVDETWSSQIYTPYRILETFEITGRTGSFTGMEQVGEWSLEVLGRSGRVLFKDGDIESSTTNPTIGSTSTYYIQGMYDWDPNAEPSTPSVIPLDCNLDGVVSVSDLNCAEPVGIEAALAAGELTHGDLNGDGTVDFTDFLTLSDNYSNEGSYTDGDLDLSGKIDFPDFLILSANYSVPAAEQAAAPEPSTLTMTFVCALGLLVLRKRSVR